MRAKDGAALGSGRNDIRWIDVYPYLDGAGFSSLRSTPNTACGGNGFTWAAAAQALLKAGVGVSDPISMGSGSDTGFTYYGTGSAVSERFGVIPQPVDPFAQPNRLKVVVVRVDHKGLRRLVWTKVVQVRIAGWQGELPQGQELAVQGSWRSSGTGSSTRRLAGATARSRRTSRDNRRPSRS